MSLIANEKAGSRGTRADVGADVGVRPAILARLSAGRQMQRSVLLRKIRLKVGSGREFCKCL